MDVYDRLPMSDLQQIYICNTIQVMLVMLTSTRTINVVLIT